MDTFNQTPASGLMLVAGMVVLMWVVFRQRNRNRRASKSTPVGRLEPYQSQTLSPLAAPPEAIRWQVEMHETARDLKAEIDSKLALLQSLVAMARQESERLEAAIARAERVGLSASRDALEEIETASARIVPLADDALNSERADHAAWLQASQQRQIFRLADLGHEPSAIAQALEMPLGDVELALSLRERSA